MNEIFFKESKDEAEADKKKREEEEDKKKADSKSSTTNSAANNSSNTNLQEEEEDIQLDDEDVQEVNLEEEEDQENVNFSNKMAFEAFLAQLPTCVNREMIDNASAEFCLTFNTKNNRRKLVKSLFTVHRTRTDLLPFYSRLCAILAPLMPDVPDQLCAMLKQDFRWQVRKKDQINIESKLKVCRFIGEMVKFNLFPKSDALFCLKQLLFDFTHHHIEMACTLVESCGTFLYRTPDTHRRIKIYIEQMIRDGSLFVNLKIETFPFTKLMKILFSNGHNS